MNRRQLVFVVLLNACVSLAIAVLVVWIADLRRPDPEELAVRYTPPPPVVLISTPTAATEAIVVTPTSALAVEPPTATPVAVEQQGEPEIYVVQQGDSLFGIAVRYNLTVDELMAANNLVNPDFVFSGQQLVIPRPGTATTGATATPVAPVANLSLQVEQPNTLETERVLIVNDSNSAINLQGWTLGGSVNDPVYTFGDLPLFPGSSVRLHSGSGQDDSLNLYWSRSAPIWASGAVVRLFNSEGREVTSYTVP